MARRHPADQNACMADDRYERLRRSISRSDPYELVTAVAALQLLPENADSLAILESAATFIATLPRGERTRSLRMSDLKAVLAEFEMTCDPSEGLFTQSVVTPAIGETIALCGRDPSAVWTL